MLTGLTMHRPLLVMEVLHYAAEINPDQEVVSSTVEGDLHRAAYRLTGAGKVSERRLRERFAEHPLRHAPE